MFRVGSAGADALMEIGVVDHPTRPRPVSRKGVGSPELDPLGEALVDLYLKCLVVRQDSRHPVLDFSI